MSPAKKKGVIYTCITGKYDVVTDHSYISPEWDYFCFTDTLPVKNKNNSSWIIKPLAFGAMDGIRNNRWHKLHPHTLFPEYQRSVYVDGDTDFLNGKIFDDFDAAIRMSKKLSLGIHSSRRCLYDELEACLQFGKDDPDIMKKQVDLIRKDGFPGNFGLFEHHIIFREHHDKKVIKIMEDWWWWVEHYSRRDQLSLVYVLWKNNFTVEPLGDIPYRKSDKVGLRRNGKHVSKEELMWRKKMFNELFQKIKKNNTR